MTGQSLLAFLSFDTKNFEPSVLGVVNCKVMLVERGECLLEINTKARHSTTGLHPASKSEMRKVLDEARVSFVTLCSMSRWYGHDTKILWLSRVRACRLHFLAKNTETTFYPTRLPCEIFSSFLAV